MSSEAGGKCEEDNEDIKNSEAEEESVQSRHRTRRPQSDTMKDARKLFA